MNKRMSRQEKKLALELETNGLIIDDVYGSRKSSSLLLCLSKALIIFMVCVGTVTGFCDAFSFNYNKPVIVIFTLIMSVLISLLYAKKKIFYIGYIGFLIVFTIELIRYYLYANSGFQAMVNGIRQVYGDFFGMTAVRSAEEHYENRNLTITIALVFIIAFLIIMYNITISRYMNFAETFGISFILMQIPLYIGKKPPLLSVILVMAGCICTGLLQKGSFNRVTIPGKNAPDYIKDRFFKKTYYTTRGDHRGILMAIAFSLIFSFVICIFSLPAYSSDLGETPEDSAKATLDDVVKILVQNGIGGLFDRYDSLNGLNRGVLGGVSSARPDFKTDMVVSFVPYSTDTVYLPGFKGISYYGSYWDNKVNTAEFPELGIDGVDYIGSDIIDSIDNNMKKSVMKFTNTPGATMQISYIDKSFGMMVFPYVTLPGNAYMSDTPLYTPKDPEKEKILETTEAYYYPLPFVEYVTASDIPSQDVSGGITIIKEITSSSYTEGSISGMGGEIPDVYGGELSGSKQLAGKNRLKYEDYVYDICLKVPKNLKKYLRTFCAEHLLFGLTDLYDYKELVNKENQERKTLGKVADDEYIEELKQQYEEAGLPVDDEQLLDGYVYISRTPTTEEVEEVYSDKEKINEFRLRACEAIKDMFLAEYPYTLSPGKTPADEDYVQYFLESQKRGFCSHFASAAVMILRYLGIPARYVEGYCVPNSLVRESAIRLEEGGDYWYSSDNEYNPEKKMYAVPVSDYYAHAWIEVYLEGQGFVPYEVTPPSFEATPEATELSGIGRFFSQILNVDLGFGNSADESSVSIIGDNSPVITDKSDMKLGVFMKPLAFIVGAVLVFWILFILIRRIVLEIRYARLLKEGKYGPLVFARYNELVRRLKRRKIITKANILPLELCSELAAYYAESEMKKQKQTDIDEKQLEELKEKKYNEILPIFIYIEKVIYSDYVSNPEEYKECFTKMKKM